MRTKKEEPVQTAMPFQKVTISDALYVIENYLEDADKLPVRLREIQKKLLQMNKEGQTHEVIIDEPVKFYTSFVVNFKL